MSVRDRKEIFHTKKKILKKIYMQSFDFFYIVDPVQAMATNYHIHFVHTAAYCVK